MKGYESATFVISCTLEGMVRRGCTDVTHGYMPMWDDEAEHIAQALADAGLLA